MALPKIAKNVLKQWLSRIDVLKPTLFELSAKSDTCSTNPLRVAYSLQGLDNVQERSLSKFVSEFKILEKKLVLRYSARKLSYDVVSAIGRNSSLVIYILIRALRPKVVHESGVANGVSSFFILNALNKNGSGELYSFDVSKMVGCLLDQDEKNRWSLIILDRKNTEASFRINLRSIPDVDFFLHDSDHAYNVQMFEYTTLYRRINRNGILASDDVDGSYAFLHFCSLNRLQPKILVESRKAFGLVRKET